MNPRTTGLARNLSLAAAFITVLARSSTAGGYEPSLPTQPSETPAAIPVALFLGDVDEDGLDDAVVIGQDGQLALLHNRGRGLFEDITLPSGLANVEGASCALLADFDGDGRVDLFIGSGEKRLWRNLGGASFMPFDSGIEHDLVDLSASAVDHDKDGRVDLHLLTEAGELLYRNVGDGRFERVELGGVGASAKLYPPSGASDTAGADDSEGIDDVGASPLRRRLARWRRLRAAAAAAAKAGNGSSSALSAGPIASSTNFGNLPLAGAPSMICAGTLVDLASFQCINASSIPTLGQLYPLSTNLNVGANGHVGIGTSAPYGKLHVVGAGGTVFQVFDFAAPPPGADRLVAAFDGGAGIASQVRFAGAPGGFIDIGQNAAGSFVVEGSDSPRLTVMHGGNVGIGTSAPETALNVKNGSLWINGLTGGNLPASAGRGVRVWHEGGLDLPVIQATDWSTLSGIDLLIQPDGGNVGLGTLTPTQKLDVAGNATISGGLGLGTANPGYRLDVVGDDAGHAGRVMNANRQGTSSIEFSNNSGGFQGALGYANPGYSAPWAGHSYLLANGSDFVMATNNTERIRIAAGGNVGFGSTTPNARIDISNVGGVDGARMLGFGESGAAEFFFSSRFLASNSDNAVAFSTSIGGLRDIMTWRADGNVGVGTNSPAAPLHSRRSNAATDDPVALFEVENCGQPCGQPMWTEAARLWNRNSNGRVGLGFMVDSAATLNTVPQVYIGTGDAADANDFRVATRVGSTLTDRLTVDGGSGLVSVKQQLEIRGGADIVERFESSCGALEPGTVVSIDPEHPGKLACAVGAYDTKVAGVVSGAGGVQPGLCLSQDGLLDGDTPVAMNGRVYVKCTASNGAINPGDRLTTAELAGHAMKVTDSARADGAVIGKAMTSLESGEGLVLVLVNLQ